jgi:hypothetical protein
MGLLPMNKSVSISSQGPWSWTISTTTASSMLALYSHVRIEAKRKAPDALANGGQNQVLRQTATQNQLREPFFLRNC